MPRRDVRCVCAAVLTLGSTLACAPAGGAGSGESASAVAGESASVATAASPTELGAAVEGAAVVDSASTVRVILWRDPHRLGPSDPHTGSPHTLKPEFDEKASSLLITTVDTWVTFFDDTRFEGDRLHMHNAHEPYFLDLNGIGWDDRIRSFMVWGSTRPNIQPGDKVCDPNPGVQCFDAPAPPTPPPPPGPRPLVVCRSGTDFNRYVAIAYHNQLSCPSPTRYPSATVVEHALYQPGQTIEMCWGNRVPPGWSVIEAIRVSLACPSDDGTNPPQFSAYKIRKG